MQRCDFSYQLPAELIADFPAKQRTASRLLQVSVQDSIENLELKHGQFSQLLELVSENDLLVLNNTRVMPARLFGAKETGAKVEILVETILNPQRARVYLKSSKSPKPNTTLHLALGDEDLSLQVLGRDEDLFIVEIIGSYDFYEVMERIGHMPLPPYIKRDDSDFDSERYQTVYAQTLGAVAAPTAGLHFDEDLLQAIKEKGADIGEVTLHVGAGTFKPVRVDDIREHHMHSEYIEVDDELVNKIKATRQRGGRVIAVGTTVVRCLETASQNGEIKTFRGDTNIFIYPGYRFQCVDVLITNFHLPESTLLMLVSAFAGYDETMHIYQQAIAERYRFYSYGDAMFIEPTQASLQARL